MEAPEGTRTPSGWIQMSTLSAFRPLRRICRFHPNTYKQARFPAVWRARRQSGLPHCCRVRKPWVGFLGRSGEYLDAIGLIYSQSTSPARRQEFMAGGAARLFRTLNTTGRETLGSAHVCGKQCRRHSGRLCLAGWPHFRGPVHGGTGGRKNVFRLDAGEYLIGISGRYGELVDSLTCAPTNGLRRHSAGGRQQKF